jgi:SM-20-related protein
MANSSIDSIPASKAITEVAIDPIIDDIVDRGWSAQANFLPSEMVDRLIREELELWQDEQFRAAKIGSGSQEQKQSEIRSDRIHWLSPDPAEQSPAVREYFAFVDQLRVTLNRSLFLSLHSFEAHFAVYPEGSFYKKHFDQFQGGQDRLITCILYLNSDWKRADGGLLRIYEDPDSEASYTDVLPEAGTFVCFRSDLIPHEVLKANRQRLSITGWLRRESLY